MTEAHFFHKEELEDRLSACVGKTLGEIDSSNVFAKTRSHPKITGIAGDVFEQSVLGYSADSARRPDLDVDGTLTELKVTGLMRRKDRWTEFEAKEPMTVTAVSPVTITDEEFVTSSFWEKAEHLLIVFYLYDSDKTVKAAEYERFPVKGYDFHEFNEDDRAILENDWTTVRDFIAGIKQKFSIPEEEYPRLSSELRGKLLYLDTAPKWPNPPRFRLKRSVVTALWEECQGKIHERLLSDVSSSAQFKAGCHDTAERFRGMTAREILNSIGYTSKSANKSMMEQVVVAMFGGTSKKMRDIELFGKMGLVSKTIVLTKDGKNTEDTKFFPVDFDEIQNRSITFDDSSCVQDFRSLFMFSIFQEPYKHAELDECEFLGFKIMTFDESFIQAQLKDTWESVRRLVNENGLKNVIAYKGGKPVVNISGSIRCAPNFPKSSESEVFLRGTGQDASKKTMTINGIPMTRQNYWIKGKTIVRLLEGTDFL